jgi:Putative Ig domain
MAYDPETSDLVLFSGSNNNGVDLNDTWIFDGSNWTQATPVSSPPPRDDAMMTYDPSIEEVVLFGGAINTRPLDDTWTWDGSSWSENAARRMPPADTGGAMSYDPTTGNLLLFSPDASSWSGTWLQVVSSVLPNATVGAAYSVSLTAMGGTSPYKWKKAGKLPPGLKLQPTTGAITGAPRRPGYFSFTVQVKDERSTGKARGSDLATRTLAIQVNT